MPRYFFDVHDDGPAEWDDVGQECGDHGAIESHVRALLTLAAARQATRSGVVPITTVIVHRDAGGIALTAISRIGHALHLIWT